MSTSNVIVVFTAKSTQRLLDEGGTSSWRLDRNNARQCEFAVCTRNAHADWVEDDEAHHSAFLVGRVKEVVVCPAKADRFLILFSEYATVDVPEVWTGDRNPVRYAESLEALKINPATLEWQKMPVKPKTKPEPRSKSAGGPMTIAEAKKALALTFGVAPEAVEITIRG